MNFKTVLFLFLIHFVNKAIAQDDDICAEEIVDLAEQFDQCGGDKLFAMNSLFKSAAKGETSADKLQTHIETVCQNINTTLNCVNNFNPVLPECHGYELTQIYRNERSLLKLLLNYMCQYKPPRFLDFLKYDGITCYAANEMKDRCMNELKRENSLDTANELLDENICLLLKITGQCLHTYENCTNKYVDNYLTVLTEQAVNAFGCLTKS